MKKKKTNEYEVLIMLNFGVIAPLLISFVISAAAGPKIIGILRRLKAGQTVRDDGPQTHL